MPSELWYPKSPVLQPTTTLLRTSNILPFSNGTGCLVSPLRWGLRPCVRSPPPSPNSAQSWGWMVCSQRTGQTVYTASSWSAWLCWDLWGLLQLAHPALSSSCQTIGCDCCKTRWQYPSLSKNRQMDTLLAHAGKSSKWKYTRNRSWTSRQSRWAQSVLFLFITKYKWRTWSRFRSRRKVSADQLTSPCVFWAVLLSKANVKSKEWK